MSNGVGGVSAPDSSSGSPPTPMLPASVAPNNNKNDGYRSYDEENGYGNYIPTRKQREFIPENKKDDGYWEKRRKNNEAARRSREKRRIHDMALETRIMDLTRENCKLRNELGLIKKKFGIPIDETFSNENNETVTPHNASHSIPTTPNPQQSSLHAEFQTARYSNGMPKSASPRNRSVSISGPIQSSYLSSYHPPTPASQHQSYMPTEPYYSSREQQESDLKGFSGKHEAQSPFHLKSMKDDNHYHQNRVDDYVRPSYSVALPPNQISPYGGALPVSSHKSYWIPTTDLTSSDSNDDSECYDRVQDQPLSLVKKRPSTENESCEDNSNSSHTSNSPTNNTSSLPLKLRHKVSNEPSTPESPPTSMPSYPNGLAQLSDIALLHSSRSSVDEYPTHNSIDSYKIRPRSYTNPRSLFDVKYVERRRRNNEAARKCRENRKQLTKLREVKSDYLENENGKLKEELVGLQEEMRELRDLLEKKRQSHDPEDGENDCERESEIVNGHEQDETGCREEDENMRYENMEDDQNDQN